MSSFKNAIPRKAHKERGQPQSRARFGILEKNKDYIVRARNFQKKREIIQRLKEKAAFRNPDEFYFKMIRTRTINGVHRKKSAPCKYTKEDFMLMKTQDIGYVFQKLQSEKKKIEKLTSGLHFLDNPISNKHIYFAEDQEEAKLLAAQASKKKKADPSSITSVPDDVLRKVSGSYRELKARKRRAEELENSYLDMCQQKELQKKGRRRKLQEEELVTPSSRPVYKWSHERKG